MSEEMTIEVKKNPEETKEAEIQAEIAEDHKEEAKEEKEEAQEEKEEAQEAAEEAKEAATEAAEAKETTQKLTSYNESVVKGLTDSISLVVQRMEQVLNIQKETAKGIEDLNAELRPTLELYQEMIGTLDETASKIITATAALVKLHKQMSETAE